jgi:hypothetical protein
VFSPGGDGSSTTTAKTTATPGRGGSTALTVALTAVKFMLQFSVHVSLALTSEALDFQGATLSVAKAK